MEKYLAPGLAAGVKTWIQFVKWFTLDFLVYITAGGKASGSETGGRSEGLDPLSARTEG